jgi:hypothetical protein
MSGGSANGHLAIIMLTPNYLARTQIEFVPPVHPGVVPAVHPVNATGNQIIKINLQFGQDIVKHQLFHTAGKALKQKILLAVDFCYLQVLEDADMGFANVTPVNLLPMVPLPQKVLKTTTVFSDLIGIPMIRLKTFGSVSGNVNALPPLLLSPSLLMPPQSA